MMITVDLQTNTFTVMPGGGVERVSPKQAELLTLLTERGIGRKNYVTYDSLEFGLYGNTLDCDRPIFPKKVIDVYACNLRRKLKPYGLDVGNLSRVGLYVFEMDEVEYTVVHGSGMGAFSGVAHVTAKDASAAQITVMDMWGVGGFPLAVFKGHHENIK